MKKCIICLEEKEATSFGEEHVIPETFYRFVSGMRKIFEVKVVYYQLCFPVLLRMSLTKKKNID